VPGRIPGYLRRDVPAERVWDLNWLIKKHILVTSCVMAASPQGAHVCPMNTRGANRNRLEEKNNKVNSFILAERLVQTVDESVVR
jgi:hypothetical protein